MARSVDAGVGSAFFVWFGCLLFCVCAPVAAQLNLKSVSVYSDISKDYFVAAIHTTGNGKDVNLFDNQLERRIELRIVARKMFSWDFSRLWVNGAAVNGSKKDFFKNTENILEFTRCIKGALVKGDVVNMTYDGQGYTTLNINGIDIFTFKRPSFFNLMLKALVGEVPLSTKMRSELLSDSHDVGPDTWALYESLAPEGARIELVQSWVEGKSDSMDMEEAENGEVSPKTDKKRLSGAKPNSKPVHKSAANKPRVKVDKNSGKQFAQVKKASSVASKNSAKKAVLTSDGDELESLEHVFTIESILAEKEFSKTVCKWLEKLAGFPILVSNRPEKDSIKFTLTLDRQGNLLHYKQFDESKFSALNRGAIKLIKKSEPYPTFPNEIKNKLIDLDFYFYLHWRYR